jgi:hypothetical protein
MGPEVKHTIEDVKQLRRDIDALFTRLESEFGGSRELSLVKTKLEEAKMWAGKELGNLGSELPAEFADKSDGSAAVGAKVAQEQRDKLTPTQTSDPEA